MPVPVQGYQRTPPEFRHRDRGFRDRDRGFRSQGRNRSQSIGMIGLVPPEPAVTIDRNGRSRWAGILPAEAMDVHVALPLAVKGRRITKSRRQP